MENTDFWMVCFLFDKRDGTYVGVKSENVSARTHTSVKNHCSQLLDIYDNSVAPSEWMVARVKEEADSMGRVLNTENLIQADIAEK